MIHFFNPGHEVAVLNSSPFYMPPANVVKMQHDLAFLPAWYAGKEDWVYVYNSIDDNFKTEVLSPLNFQAQSFSIGNIETVKDELMNQYVEFWGISPQSIHLARQISESYNLNLNIPLWNNEYKKLCSRDFSVFILNNIIEHLPETKQNIIPEVAENIDQIRYISADSRHRYVVKAPYSSSGRGLLWLPENGLTRTEVQILNGMLKKQSFVTVEKVLNKKLDFAMEFLITENNITFAGYSVFKTNEKGAYMGNYVESQQSLEQKINQYIDSFLLDKVKQQLMLLAPKYISPFYTGCIGMDMMIYEENGQYYLHPCLEINMRYNMGYLSIKLYEQYISKKSNAFFSIEFSNKHGAISDKCKRLSTDKKAVFEQNKLVKGFLPLCPVNDNSNYMAYLIAQTKE